MESKPWSREKHRFVLAIVPYVLFFIFFIPVMEPPPLSKAQRDLGIVCILHTRSTIARWTWLMFKRFIEGQL